MEKSNGAYYNKCIKGGGGQPKKESFLTLFCKTGVLQ
jgi:hypothetical protein